MHPMNVESNVFLFSNSWLGGFKFKVDSSHVSRLTKATERIMLQSLASPSLYELVSNVLQCTERESKLDYEGRKSEERTDGGKDKGFSLNCF